MSCGSLSQRATKAESVSKLWRHYSTPVLSVLGIVTWMAVKWTIALVAYANHGTLLDHLPRLPSKLVIAFVKDFLCSWCADLKPFWIYHVSKTTKIQSKHTPTQCELKWYTDKVQPNTWKTHHALNINTIVNTLRPKQNGRHFADDTFKRSFLNENMWISNKISLKFVPKVPINNIPALVQIMAWRRPGDKPLSEAMMVR